MKGRRHLAEAQISRVAALAAAGGSTETPSTVNAYFAVIPLAKYAAALFRMPRSSVTRSAFNHLLHRLGAELIRVLLVVAHKRLGYCHELWLPDIYERLAGPVLGVLPCRISHTPRVRSSEGSVGRRLKVDVHGRHIVRFFDVDGPSDPVCEAVHDLQPEAKSFPFALAAHGIGNSQ